MSVTASMAWTTAATTAATSSTPKQTVNTVLRDTCEGRSVGDIRV